MLVIEVTIGSFTFGIGAWVAAIVFAFVYNKIYIKELLEKGYRPADGTSQSHLQAQGIIAA